MKKIKKRFIILIIYIILAIAAGFTIVSLTGTNYILRTHIGVQNNNDIEKLNIRYSKEGIIEYTGYNYSETTWADKELVINFKSLSPGDTKVELYIKNYNSEPSGWIHGYDFHVNSFGIIIDKTYGINFTGYNYIMYLILSVFIFFSAVMIWSFIESKNKARFSYSMIAYGGLALFSTSLLVFLIYKILNNSAESMRQFIKLIIDIGEEFIIVTTPLMLVMAVAVSVSNIWLMKNEGFRPVNGLGIAISVLWLAGFVFLQFQIKSESIVAIEMVSFVKFVTIYILSYFECMMISTIVCAFLSSKYTPPLNKDYIIILGCAIRSDGSLTPILKSRVDSAVKFEHRQFKETGKHAVFVPSGGQGADEVISEGEAMERYLKGEGIPENQIYREDKSVNTYQNMKFSKEVIDKHNVEGKEVNIAFATTNYHIFRGYILSKKLGFTAQGISAKTKWYFFPNAFLREFIGLLVDKKWQHLIYIALTILTFLVLKYL